MRVQAKAGEGDGEIEPTVWTEALHGALGGGENTGCEWTEAKVKVSSLPADTPYFLPGVAAY